MRLHVGWAINNNRIPYSSSNGCTWLGVGYGTVELLITDPPRSDHPLYNGQPLWNGLNLP